ncbi:MAG: hypothetical protein JNL28_14875 [Planctomycetes bacterium]|nr:hypothetical protein [Planctomycetota bacterium]
MAFKRSTLVLALTVLSVGATACRRVEPVGSGGGAALMRNLMRGEALEIVAEERGLTESLQRAAARLRSADASVRFDAFVTEGHPVRSRKIPRIVVGTRDSNRALVLAQRIGVVVDRTDATTRFQYGGEEFADAADACIATFEDPDRPGLPVTLVFANSEAAVAAHCVTLLPAWRPWMRVLHQGRVAREGPLHLDGAPRSGEFTSFTRARSAREAALVPITVDLEGFDVRTTAGMPPDAFARYAGSCRASLQHVRAWCAFDGQAPALDLVVWTNVFDYLEDGDPNALSTFDPLARRTDALILYSCDDGGAGVARAWASSALGAPAEPWMLDAAGVDAAWTWWGRPMPSWLAGCTAAVGVRKLSELTAADATESDSAHVISPLRGALWRFLRETRGPEFVRELWRGTQRYEPVDADQEAFTHWVMALAQSARAEHEQHRAARRAGDWKFDMLRGIGTCDFRATRGQGRLRGYGSLEFDTLLDGARTLGADALLVTAFARHEPGIAPVFGDATRRELAPREGDVRILAALLAGSAHGMRTLLSPHLLSGDGGTFSGTWTRSDERGWQEFFDRYARFVEHHAALAELGGASVLSIGTRLAEVSSSELVGRRPNAPEAEWKRAGWARVVAAARGPFSGALTYAAGSPEELEKVPFFTDLDYVGLELSPTLDLDDTSDGLNARNEITRLIDFSLDALERTARVTGRRALLTQATFSPTLDGAASVLGVGHTSTDWQAQQYLDLSERLKVWSGSPTLAGVFVWRFGAEADEPDYSPLIDTARARDAVRALLESLPRR